MKFCDEKNFKGNAYSRRPCIYLLASFEQIPKVLKPGNNVSKLNIKELALDDEWANTTTLF